MIVLDKKIIPFELWNKKLINMPMCIVDAYEKSLNENGIMEIALRTECEKGAIGGSSLDDTLRHFATRYGVSVCRLEGLVIDPENAFTSIPDDLLITFSDGIVSILDAPCGTGAAGTSILSTIATLRNYDLLPKLPLDIIITGGDYSEHALNIYEDMLNKIKPVFNSVGINIYFSKFLWDARRPETTAELIDEWFKNSKDAEEYLSIIANFSGETSKSFSKFARSFEHIHERLYNKNASVIWIEPKMKGSESYLKKIMNMMKNYIGWSQKKAQPLNHTYSWYHPFQKRCWPCKILVQKYTRN